MSAYILAIEEKTPFIKLYKDFKYPMPPEDVIYNKGMLLESLAKQSGLSQYQVSNFAVSEKYESVHNNMYWDSDVDYLAFGVGSASLIDGYRFKRPMSMKKYYDWVDSITKLTEENFYDNFVKKGDDSNRDLYSSLENKFLGKFITKKGVTYDEISMIFDKFNKVEYSMRFWDMLVKNLGKYREHLCFFGNSIKFNGMNGFLVSNTITTEILTLTEEFLTIIKEK